MDILTSMPFLGGSPPGVTAPLLGRFLPPIPAGIADAWLARHTSASNWVLDPFGTSPGFAAEAAAAGRRVLVAANNPVTRFLLELAADPPDEADFKAALAELALTRKGSEQLDRHILSLYETMCANCGRPVSADAFIWEAANGTITRRIYTCPHCGDAGEREATPADIERAAQFAAGDAMHRSRALTRVAPPDDPDRPFAEEALHVYLPRAVYVLGTLINRLDQITLSPARLRALHALLLNACDAGDALWSHDTDRPRPRSLQLPGAFRENNVWKALEAPLRLPPFSAKIGGETEAGLTTWPELPPESGGVCIFEGALRDLTSQIREIPFAAAMGVFPRPNPAFWTLSALWAGWLWGRESAAPFKSVLRRRRYDWQWHAEALRAALTSLREALPVEIPFFALLAEAEPPFVSAALAAAGEANFALQGVSMRTADDPLQFLWQGGENAESQATPFDPTVLRSALAQFLAARAEPVTYLHAYLAGSAGLAGAQALPLTDDLSNDTTAAIQEALADPLFVRYKAKAGSESGLWGLAEPGEEFMPLSDRVERAVVRFLTAHPGCTTQALEADLYRGFAGMLTPSLGLVGAVLESYALDEHGWLPRAEDAPSARRAEVAEISSLVEGVGKRLDYDVLRQDDGPVLWQDDLETVAFFFVQASAVLERVLRLNKYPPDKTILVIPGGRAGLLAYKLRRDPYLSGRTQDWRFVKFRHLRQLGETALLSRETWQEQLSADPIEQTSGQMLLF